MFRRIVVSNVALSAYQLLQALNFNDKLCRCDRIRNRSHSGYDVFEATNVKATKLATGEYALMSFPVSAEGQIKRMRRYPMYSTDDDSANPAEKCPLHELPSTLLYEVTKNLDISSQRSLFLASLHLYRQWHLQVPGEDHEWRFLNWSLDVLAQFSSQSGCDMRDGRTFIHAYFSDIDRQARISYPDQQRNNFAALLSSDDRDLDAGAWVGSLMNPKYMNQGLLTKEQVLKRCISSPGLDGSSIAFASSAEGNTVNQQELKALAHRLFSLLLKNEGFVVFRFARHANLLVTRLQDGWKINLKPCSVDPPVIDLTAYTGERSDLEHVWGKLYSRGSLATNSLSDINLSSWVLSENRRRS